MAALLLVMSSLLLMLWRVAAPFGQKCEGREVLTVRLGLRERMLFHRTGLYSFGVILLLMAAARQLSPTLQLIALLACYAILMIPVRYRLTTTGLGVNNIVFRRWQEFASVSTSRRAVTLLGKPGNGRLTLRLLSDHQIEALTIIRRQIGAAPTAGRSAHSRRGGRPAKTHARGVRG